MLSRSCIEPDWPCSVGVRALTTTVVVPGTDQHGFNLASHVNDSVERVHQHRDVLRAHARLPAEPLWLNQVHGSVVLDAADYAANPTADATYSDAPGVVLAVLTADCLPILITDTEGRAIAAVHAGWRGLAAGIIAAAITKFTVSGIEPHELVVWLGPAIGRQAYEIDLPVHDSLVRCLPPGADCLEPVRPGHWLLDMPAAARALLEASGVAQVHGGTHCTYTDTRFFSYRRDPACGRQATLIWREGL